MARRKKNTIKTAGINNPSPLGSPLGTPDSEVSAAMDSIESTPDITVQPNFESITDSEVSATMDAIENTLDMTVQPNFKSITAAIKVILSTMQSMAKSMDFQAKTFDNLLVESKRQTKIIEELSAEVIACKKSNNELKTANEILNAKLNDLEQYSKNYNIEIQGVPELEGEDTYSIVATIANKLGCTVHPNQIEYSHRIRQNKNSVKKSNMPPAIIAKFFSRRVKDAVIEGKKTKRDLVGHDIGFDNSNAKIYVNDHLTVFNKNLFWLARSARNVGFKFAWTKNGKVYLRKEENSPVLKIAKPSDIPANA